MFDFGHNLQYLNLKHVQIDQRQLLNITRIPKLKQLILGRLADFHSKHLEVGLVWLFDAYLNILGGLCPPVYSF